MKMLRERSEAARSLALAFHLHACAVVRARPPVTRRPPRSPRHHVLSSTMPELSPFSWWRHRDTPTFNAHSVSSKFSFIPHQATPIAYLFTLTTSAVDPSPPPRTPCRSTVSHCYFLHIIPVPPPTPDLRFSATSFYRRFPPPSARTPSSLTSHVAA